MTARCAAAAWASGPEDRRPGPADPGRGPDAATRTPASGLPLAAIRIGQAFLAAQRLLDTSGEAELFGYVEDTSGVQWPAWMVRAGDTITFMDAADTSPRRIVRTEYSDSTKSNRISLDSPSDGLQAMLERLGVTATTQGFS